MDMHKLIKTRRTIRKFRQTPLSEEQLLRYVDAARLAPSAGNLQPLKYVIVHSRAMTEKMFPLVKWAAYLAPVYNPKEEERPMAYIVVLADLSVRQSGYNMDVGAAVENLILSAWADGVGSCFMGAIDRPEISKLLELGDNFTISCVVALGYPAETPRVAEAKNDTVQYYLNDDGTLCVPKRSTEDVLVKML